MNALERTCIKIRHLPLLNSADAVWDLIRPTYNATVNSMARKGLRRLINKKDELLVSPKWRNLQEIYEPEFWNKIMDEIKPGDTFVDVGAFIGLYSVCAAKRVGASGGVYAFEPDNTNFGDLSDHVKLNKLNGRVHIFNAAVTDFDGIVSFQHGSSCESHIIPGEARDEKTVRCVKLDSLLGKEKLDVLKIDVEGFEEHVLRGAQQLLRSIDQRPRSIYMEVHPFAWSKAETTSESLLSLIGSFGYRCLTLAGIPITKITDYGSVVARAGA